ncbi:PaREP1 family protein [Vulcanisaeta distributa]|uniref:PaREP1 family protein n=1 Tax=Vulcanisaeta distributa TaxID=164451 RepID=UPI0006D07D71|nr:PaREP1 family protein [Vulcanisaeta distributa]
MELPKPWFDIDGYRRTRLLEARYEAELARRFLDEGGLTRNAAGKAFQAWKSFLAAISAGEINELSKVYRRRVKVRGGLRERINEALYIIAFMPVTRMFEVSKILSALNPMMPYLTLASLELHRYQYNGPDREGVFSVFRSDDDAEEFICKFLSDMATIYRELVKEEFIDLTQCKSNA